MGRFRVKFKGAATIRKHFSFRQEVAEHLEQIAQSANKSMSVVLQELIESHYKKIKHQQKLEAFQKIKDSARGVVKDATVQSIKADYDN